ncbi:hypothetical protein Tcan_11114 [Toxocara canis]|uniref:Uncharacterized protein n=1 Tax=Toxocara canis TaxID=6265 RepID=A0A0B2VPJ3_TOXCA|nr:hypothetical protein Tcan_11114 [Toxocara canis]
MRKIRLTWIIIALVIVIVLANFIAMYNIIKLLINNRPKAKKTTVLMVTTNYYTSNVTSSTPILVASTMHNETDELPMKTPSTRDHQVSRKPKYRRKYRFDKKLGKYVRIRKKPTTTYHQGNVDISYKQKMDGVVAQNQSLSSSDLSKSNSVLDRVVTTAVEGSAEKPTTGLPTMKEQTTMLHLGRITSTESRTRNEINETGQYWKEDENVEPLQFTLLVKTTPPSTSTPKITVRNTSATLRSSHKPSLPHVVTIGRINVQDVHSRRPDITRITFHSMRLTDRPFIPTSTTTTRILETVTTTMTTTTTTATSTSTSALTTSTRRASTTVVDSNSLRLSGFTVVTALLDIGRGQWWEYRRPLNSYYKYLDNILELRVNLMIFVDQKTVDYIHQRRKQFRLEHLTRVIPMRLTELPLHQYIGLIEQIIDYEQNGNGWNPAWDQSMKVHPEAKSAAYDVLVNSKSFFLYNASIENPFMTEKFVWLDAGYGHGNRAIFPPDFYWNPFLPQDKISLIKTALVLLIQQQPTLFNVVHGDWFDAFRLFAA